MEDILDKNNWQNLLNRANQGDADAQYEVGFYFENGLFSKNEQIVSIDLKQAFTYYKTSSDNGHVDGLVRTADFLSEGLACKIDIDNAIHLYEKAINHGSAIAANNLATIYRDKSDYKSAFNYWKLSQDLDCYGTSISLAFCYYYGIGTEINKKLAFDMFIKISDCAKSDSSECKSDIDEANFMLGKIYLEGVIVEQSISKSRKYLTLANSDNDHLSAQELLNIIGR